MNRLLIITTIPDTIRGFLLPLAHHFRFEGWQVDAMAQGVSACEECLAAFDQVWDVQWSRNPLDPQNLLLAPRTIQEVIAQKNYDIIHVHTPVAAFITRYALRGLIKQGKPRVIYTAHGFHFYRGGQPLKNALFLTLEKLAGNWTDYLVVINHEDKEAAKQYNIVPPKQIRYMPGIGVDLEYYNFDATPVAEVMAVYEELGITPENPLFLSVAEFIPRKHHQDILRAFACLERPDVHLALAGDGDEEWTQQMQDLASALGIKPQVHFLGFRRDIPTLIQASIATLLVSEQEGLPRSVMESLCLETPVIGTNIRGTRDLLAGDCGLLVEVGDIEGIAQAMTWVLDHPEDALAMAKRGRDHMSAYDLQNILELHEALYSEAISDRILTPLGTGLWPVYNDFM
ncbi:MAG: glycosyltransferase family 4 protein [Moorea sp. SIO3C2]|nr:glycosyltransferase family 4 protein [Moorena sp. SIO3C2]